MSARDAQRALAALERARAKGRAARVVFARIVNPEQLDPDTGDYGTALAFEGTALVLPASGTGSETFEERTLIATTMRRLIVGAHGMTHAPAPGDIVSFPNGQAGTVIGCSTLAPDVVNPIIYECVAKV